MDVQGKVIESITKILKDRGEIKDSETVTVDLRLDEIESLIRTEAVMEIEVAFNLGYTPQREIDKMRTVQDVVNYVQRITETNAVKPQCQTPVPLL